MAQGRRRLRRGQALGEEEHRADDLGDDDPDRDALPRRQARQVMGEERQGALGQLAVEMQAPPRERLDQVPVLPDRPELRPPLEGRPAALVYRNGEFELVDASA